MYPTHCDVRVGPVSVALRSNELALVNYLAEFYEFERGVSGAAAWSIDTAVGSVVGLSPPNRWGVAHRVESASRTVVVRSEDLASLAITTRKLIREVLIDHCERRRYVMIHASACANDERVVIVVGDKGAGKTTLALRALLDHRFRLVSNDHLILFAGPGPERLADRLRLTSLPTPIPVKVGTYLDLEERLPRPWDDEGIDLEAFRSMPRTVRYRLRDDRVFLTYRSLGQVNPGELSIGPVDTGPEVVVVLASYAAPDEKSGDPQPVNCPQTALWPHVRFDWVFDPDLNTQHLPRGQRCRDAYAADARPLLAALTNRAEVVSWSHRGDPTPMLRATTTSRGRSCTQ